MKHRIKKHLSIIIALSMLLSLIPLYGAAVDDEFEGFETLEEIPFEFELEPGDLPFEQLKDAVLAAEDIPSCIDPALAEARGHVNRLYLQEPDDYTVMFQNVDGSKTIYVFSQPVKGSSLSTTAAITVNGGKINFSGSNIITSRIGTDLRDYNIGYCEIQTLPSGILSADGVDITSDARGWARGESNAAELSYNISSEAAAEYAASITLPDTEISTAALVPGTTITPITPAPLTGATVMSISYSDLAGLMSFKNAATEQYLTMRTSATNPLLVNNNIVVPFSRWIVSYDSTYGYTVTNLYQPANYYLGLDDNDALAVTSLNNLTAAFTIAIVSTTDSKVTISFGNKAIDSTASVYSNDPSASSFPTSCEWFIYTKTDCNLVESITPVSSLRTVNSGAIFYGEYTTTPTTPTYSDIELYFASSDQTLPNDSDYDLTDSTAYYVSELGTYAVYYKDNCTGVRSANFTLNVVEYVTEITVTSSVRIEQKNVGFELDYSFTPPTSTYYSISLYYADTNTEVPHTGDTYMISTPGVYTVYYMDSVSGVTSENFTLVIYDIPDFTIANSLAEPTFSIKPVDAPSKYLTMNVSASGATSLELEAYNIQELEFHGQKNTYYNEYENWEQLSRAFTIESKSTSGLRYEIASILTKNQYVDDMPLQNKIGALEYLGSNYAMTDRKTKPNTLKVSSEIKNDVVQYSVDSAVPIDSECELTILKIEDYYVIFTTFDSNNILNNPALKYVSTSTTEGEIQIAPYNPTATEFRWTIDQLGVNAPLIRQTEKFTCGPATFLQVLYGAGIGSQVAEYSSDSGKGLHSQMMTLKNNVLEYIIHSDTPGYESAGTSQDSFSTKINNYSLFDNNATGNYYRWQKSSAGTTGFEDVKNHIDNSLKKGWAPFFMTSSGGAPYRFDQGGGTHFICIIGYEEYINDEGELDAYVIVSNCHYITSLNSIFAIPYGDFYDNCIELFCYSETPIIQGG